MTPRRLRAALLVFFLALATPTALLVWHAYDQLKWEAFYRFRLQAEELTARVDAELAQAIRMAEARGFADYAFLIVTGDPSANFFERSPLARFPVDSTVPGTLGYFQVDPSGRFSSPLVPAPGADATQFGVADDELRLRRDLAGAIQAVLQDNELVEEGSPELAELPADLVLGRSAEQPSRLSSNNAAVASKAEGGGADAVDEFRGLTQAPVQTELEEVMVRDAPTVAPVPAAAEPSANQAFADLAEADSLVATPSARRRQLDKTNQAPLRKVEDLKLDSRYVEKKAPAGQRLNREARLDNDDRSNRKEQVYVPESGKLKDADDGALGGNQLRISTFESEVSPFEFRLLGSGHFVLFRQVWRNGQRYIQGVVIDQQEFVRQAIQAAFSATALYEMSDLVVAYQGGVLTQLSGSVSSYPGEARDLAGALLYRARLTAPLDALELIFSVNRLPAGPGGPLLGWVTGILVLVSCIGFFMVYRYGIRQIELARQQQDFVSAVSHELKTPLTSIRMYGEMLKEGWAAEDKRQTYYNYIYDESERLSRLIANVLQLARMSRNELQVEVRTTTVAELMDIARSKVESQVEHAGFEVRLECDAQVAGQSVDVDVDAFTQILINLVDNALKFSRGAETRRVEIAAQAASGQVMFSVRDFGPGVPPTQMKKIFKLFYRLENELTRETVGTGIGLALVHQLCRAMGGNVDVINREPGAEFRVFFPLH